MADVRSCEQCGALFEPRREHARFCSVRCRRAWNRDKLGEPVPGMNALGWSVAAMKDVADLLAEMGTRHGPRAFAVIEEMVWWVTIVDATLVRYHADVYDGVLASHAGPRRRRIEGTLGGLRFVRNQMRGDAGCGDFIRQAPGCVGGVQDRPVTDWTWQPVPEPPLGSLPARAWAWEMSRYRAYQAHLVGHAIGEVFGLATAFLELAASSAASAASQGPVALSGRDVDRRYAGA